MAGFMIKKRCTYCGRHCFHNPMKAKPKEEQTFRCTFCGHPPQGNEGQGKKEYQVALRDRQARSIADLVGRL